MADAEVQAGTSPLKRIQPGRGGPGSGQHTDIAVAHFKQPQASVARRAGWQWLRWVSGLPLHDFASGMRLYQRPAMQAVTSAQAGLLDHQDIGSLLLMQRHGLRITEVPLSLRHPKPDRSSIFRSWAKALHADRVVNFEQFTSHTALRLRSLMLPADTRRAVLARSI